MKNSQALILAGGLGTRLGDLTKEKPKPMMEINGKPFLAYIVNFLKKFSVTDIIITSGYLGKIIEDYFGDGKKFGVNIKYVKEKELLGTGGAIKNAESLLKEEFLILNGDSFCNVDLDKLQEFHSSSNSKFTMVLTEALDNDNDVVITKPDGEIISVLQRNSKEDEEFRAKNQTYINGGIYYMSKSILDLIPKGKKVSLEKDVFPLLIGKVPFFGLKFDTKVMDIGTPERIKVAEQKFKEELNSF